MCSYCTKCNSIYGEEWRVEGEGEGEELVSPLVRGWGTGACGMGCSVDAWHMGV